MAKLFVTSINLNKNELQNARIQNLSSNPSNPVAGQIYFNNVENEMRTYDGTQWVGSGSIKTGALADRPAASKQGLLYATTDTKVLYLDVVTGWLQVGVGTDTVDILTGKTIGDKLYFGTENTYDSYIEGQVDSSGDLEIRGGNNLNLTTQNGDIILDPDGSAYIGSAVSGNRIVTVDELNSGDVIQSVTGTTGEITADTDEGGNVTLSLPNIVDVHSGLNVGSDSENETNQDGEFTIWKADGSTSFVADSTGVEINGLVEIQDGSGNPKLNISYSGTGATRITSDDDIAIRSNDGDIILYPGSDASWGGDGGTGKAYVGWGNDETAAAPENEITTAGNTQSITNKTVNDELYFTNPSTQPNDGGIKINDSNENFEIRAYVADLNLYSDSGDINFAPNGTVNVDSNLDVNGQVIAPTVVGTTFDGADGSLTLTDGGDGNTSAIHINGTTKNIELLPNTGSKAFYGSAATAGNEIAKLSDLQALSSGLNWKQAVNLLSTSNIAIAELSSPPTSPPMTSLDLTGVVIDGHEALDSNDDGYRILLLGQTDSTENGIYLLTYANGELTASRSTDSNEFTELIGAAVFVMEGTQYGSTSWVQTNHYIVDFDNQEWIQFSGQGTYVGSDSIQVDGNQINALVNTDKGLAIDGDGIKTVLGEGLVFSNGAVTLNPGTGFDIATGYLEFASGYGVRKYAQLVGDGTATSFYVEHGFGTRSVTVQVFQNGSNYAQVEADVEHTDTSGVTIKFAAAPTSSEYEVVIIG